MTNTSSPVDLDQLNDIYRAPIGERLAILINEFGTGLAGRGQALNDVIHRANPALRDTDKVLAVLASQNRTLADLAKNSDRVLIPLAAKRQPARRLHRAGEHDQSGHGRGEQQHLRLDRALPGLPEAAAADAGGSRRAGRPDDPGDHRPGQGGAGTQPLHRGARPVLAGVDPGAHVAGRRDGGGPQRARGRAACRQRPAPVRHQRRPGVGEPREAHHQPEQDGRGRRPDGLHPQLDDRDQRLRRREPLPARRADREHLRHLRHRAGPRSAWPPSRSRSASTATSTAADKKIQAELEKARSAQPKKPSLLSRILSIAAEPASQGGAAQPGVKRIQQNASNDSSQAFGPSDPALKYLLGN